jgi:hypothetical protein
VPERALGIPRENVPKPAKKAAFCRDIEQISISVETDTSRSATEAPMATPTSRKKNREERKLSPGKDEKKTGIV